ncbi:MAG: hypothetical protein RLZZ157_869 [Pseudomonadota bacterium]|jgi:hypothetical protein
MFDDSKAFISRSFLRSNFEVEYKVYLASGDDERLRQKLLTWNARVKLSETQAESAFITTFFEELWGYGEAGRVDSKMQSMFPKFRVPGEGAGGGPGEVDLALGWFRGNSSATPQVMCEFKDIKSALDLQQNRKGNRRSPVQQCFNYIRGARRGLFGNEPVQPWWGIVTDMNEFRLYWWDRQQTEYLRFVIQKPNDLFAGDYDLLSECEAAQFDRFVFSKIFQRDVLLSQGGQPQLARMLEKQWTREQKLEGEFYKHYRAVRERLFSVLKTHNPDFSGSVLDLLRISQKVLDRFIFGFYCEDMGLRLSFPPQLIRDRLKERSKEGEFEENGDELWTYFRKVFAAMNTGSAMGKLQFPHINGGLFKPDPLIDDLTIPNHVFVARDQGYSDATLERDQNTIFYLSARYNYAADGEGRETLTLYTLGRIFEQSITELEYRAGELEGRDSLAKISKRKRDGVYYTPEWIVNYLVAETLGPWFEAAKIEAGLSPDNDTPPTSPAAQAYIDKLKTITIIDPACGSGAFLIAAFRALLEERRAAERLLLVAKGGNPEAVLDDSTIIAEILTNNIFGVDINPASVEIAKLALWLHSARKDGPLSGLETTIVCGNSLVGDDFWQGRTDAQAQRDRVNSFDWKRAFPQIWPRGQEGGGFDIVLGNPPYVKLQNLMQLDPNVATHIQAERGDDTYISARTGNTDLYLPFIEKGLRILARGGRMAYIAPSLWAVNEYGLGLRSLVLRNRSLERWVDFKAFQIFDEAITYTALQFFSAEPQTHIKIALAPGGKLGDVDWQDDTRAIPYDEFGTSPWLIADKADRDLINRLAQTCLRLDDRSLTSGIIVGVQTSADSIYHLRRIGTNRYLCQPAKEKGAKAKPPAFEVAIEDAIMKPLISGAEAKRYEDPQTDTYLLFPYLKGETGKVSLISKDVFEADFPRAWAYLKRWEAELRGREKGKFDNEAWYQFGRNQNLDKQDVPKLIVAQTVPEMRVCEDASATKYLNNVRVNGILSPNLRTQGFLLGCLNAPVADFVLRRIGKPKQGDYLEANKQFIAPIPIPDTDEATQTAIGNQARALQTSWSQHRDILVALKDRLEAMPRTQHRLHLLWSRTIPELDDIVKDAPKALNFKNDRLEWAQKRLEESEKQCLSTFQGVLDTGVALKAEFKGGELRLVADTLPVIQGIYLDGPEGAIACSYWDYLMLTYAKEGADKLASRLANLPTAPDTPVARQFQELVIELAHLTSVITNGEAKLNAQLYDLYALTPDERFLVEKQAASRRMVANQG